MLDARTELGEGPLWDERGGRLLFVDILVGTIRSFHPVTRAEESVQLDSTVGCVVLDDDGAMVAAAGTRILRLADGGQEVLAVTDDAPDAIRFNDGACDPQGRLWAGTMALDESRGKGSLYRLDARGLEKVLAPVSISNGIDWSPDGKTMYYADSLDYCVWAFAFDGESGEVGGQRALIECDEAGGLPTGSPSTVRAASGSRSGTAGACGGTRPTGASSRSSSCRSLDRRAARSAAPSWTSCSSPRPERGSTTPRERLSPTPARCSRSGPGSQAGLRVGFAGSDVGALTLS